MTSRPLLTVCLAYVAGVALAAPGSLGRWPLVVAAAGLLLAGLGRRTVAAVGGLALLAAALGAARCQLALDRFERQPLLRQSGETRPFVGTVSSAPRPLRSGEAVVELRLERLQVSGGWLPVQGTVRVGGPAAATAPWGRRVSGRVVLRAPRRAGNPGEASPYRRLRADGVTLVGELDGALTDLGAGAVSWLERLAQALRQRCCGGVRAAFRRQPPLLADLLNAMVFGLSAAPVDAALSEACRRAGVTHLLVASGTQVSLLLGLVLLGSAARRLPPSLSWVAAAAAVLLYVLVTGGDAAILRAAVMGLLLFGALASGQDYDLPTALGVAAAGLLLWRPLQVQDLGFQLSFAATIGLTALGLPLLQRLPARWRWLAGPAVLTVGAQSAVAPVAVYQLRQISWVGLPANLPVLPLSGLLVGGGLLASLLGPAGTWVAAPLAWLLRWFLALVGWFAAVPGGFRQPAVAAPWQLVLGVAGGVLMAAWLHGWRPRWEPTRWLPVLLTASALATLPSLWRAAEPTLTVQFLDVGQGQATLLRGPGGRSVLIDAGPRRVVAGQTFDAGADQVVPALLLAGVRRLDAVLVTHCHADHVGGLASVLTAFATDRLLLGELPAAGVAADLERALALAGRRGVAPELVRRGTVLDLGNGARLTLLWPPAEPLHGTGEDRNNNALVGQLVYGDVSFLLTSDLEAQGEELLLRLDDDLRATVLQVPHQGSAGSTTPALLAAVQPAEAVITVGPNTYGHPAPETVA
ncbi:MAG: DNA internalization-related competence protein ComEC/Rec2, partial [Fimbriimonadaceae bacterium]|nr:DNA internalization-related competence protein ComEC/Rec2 [Fimbriimonadaceae bacterium]